jgi:hypothetical protein
MVKSSVTPNGFRVGIHKPSYLVPNFRCHDYPLTLGILADGSRLTNERNFPAGDVKEEKGCLIYEIINPLPFRGAVFIDSSWAESRATNPGKIKISFPPACSLKKSLTELVTDPDLIGQILSSLPKPLLYDLAANSTDGEELVIIARNCCRFVDDKRGNPCGLYYRKDEETGQVQADIDDFEIFETIANNPYLPDIYKEVMALRPGTQGASEIVGDYRHDETNVFEYLRRNSYIPHGHFAANMGHDSIRYSTAELSDNDMHGLRHLYYQRVFVTLAEQLDIDVDIRKRPLSDNELEQLRIAVISALANNPEICHSATLWGWNFGYDFSGSGYRLHASHQMIHQQYAMIPRSVDSLDGGQIDCYGCGDMVADVIKDYRADYDRDFFADYLLAIRGNRRMDGNHDLSSELIVYENSSVILFVPKAQVSQWELQIMVIADAHDLPVGNIVEADSKIRNDLDRTILIAQKIYAALGVRMVTSIEYPKRIGLENGQRLIYAFLPKLPWSMGGFSEAQQRYICGHFPEDFGKVCADILMPRKYSASTPSSPYPTCSHTSKYSSQNG